MIDTAGGKPGVDGGLKSVLSALELLDCFIDDEEFGVSELARRLDVSKSTAHRLLTTLTARGYIQQDPESARYRLGIRVIELGQLAARRARLHRTALPLLEHLRQLTSCTVHLAVPDGADVVYLERLSPIPHMRRFAQVERRIPAHQVSSGKAIAAFNPELATLRRVAGFARPAGEPPYRTADFDRSLTEIKARGVAITHDVIGLGLSSVAVPVRDASGIARAAISVAGPTVEVAQNTQRFARLVGAASAKLERALR
ncbi:helix-turn-helix domain-containing protein [Herbidospora sp. NEAU-GS84]|uniref:Glycerol operon regulatory protein n=1 Tax=Herbidospora solisilvae TaxID=2696284 RepID=A0A7C9J6S1_9ACTN|nr:IclR family transcriptional regulator [Herbidospora solisilvae]NAS25945.1 helix-turn-helix domain-containing protein [Herbidospora solisilvae]